MKKIVLFSLILALGSVFQVQGEDYEPGRQVLKQAELPAFVGGPSRYDDEVDPVRTETFNYWLFFPKNDAAKTEAGYPLLLFLHGSGERGTDPEIVKDHGPAKLCDDPKIQQTWRFITVSPQGYDGRYWSPKQMLALIEQVCEAYPVDRSRIYATGLSLGGSGTWGLASLAGDKLAAIAPVCGRFAVEKADTIKLPVWAFQGAKDTAVKLEEAAGIVNAVREAGNDEVIFTVYPDLPHDCWTTTYNDPLLYDWLLSKSKK